MLDGGLFSWYNAVMKKTCCKCGEVKPTSEFHRDKHSADGLRHRCKWCVSRKNPNRHGPCDAKRVFQQAVETGVRQCTRCKLTKPLSEFYSGGRRSDCGECCRAMQNEKNKCPARKARQKARDERRRQDPDYYRKQAEWQRRRAENDPAYRIKTRAKAAVVGGFSRRGWTKRSRTHELLGCSFEEFLSHLVSLAYGGMTVEDILSDRVELDHVVPISSAATVEDVERLSHFSNFQPLWKNDNREKRDRTDWVHPRDR